MPQIKSETLSKLKEIAKNHSNYVGSDDPTYLHLVENRFFNELKELIEQELRTQKDEILNSKIQELQFNPIDSLNEYQKIAMQMKAYGAGLPVFYPALKLCGESGEVAEKVAKGWRDANGEFDEERIKGIKFELGDVLWYITAVADDLGFNLIDVANLNITKIVDRRARKVVNGNGDYR